MAVLVGIVRSMRVYIPHSTRDPKQHRLFFLVFFVCRLRSQLPRLNRDAYVAIVSGTRTRLRLCSIWTWETAANFYTATFRLDLFLGFFLLFPLIIEYVVDELDTSKVVCMKCFEQPTVND